MGLWGHWVMGICKDESYPQMSMAACKLLSVASTSFCTSSDTFPTQIVRLVSPWYPFKNTVTSTLMMSPSISSVVSGMPWQMHSFREVHTDLGKPP